ncbi:MAG: pseudouridine synthase [Pseudomonadota bacterium]
MVNRDDIAAADGERIAKVIARAGYCSRREAETLVEQGRVSVDGKVLETPAVKVRPGQDVRVDGERLKTAEPVRLWRFHKPAGLVTTHKDPQGRPTVFEALPDKFPRVVSVGRLDLTTEGLLLLTTDGGLARHLELPANGWVRRYRARVHGRVTEKALAEIAEGVEVDGVQYGPVKAALDRTQGASNAWLTIAIKEGKNREVRKILDHLGLKTARLIRTAYGPFQIGALKTRAFEEVPRKQLVEQLGKKAAAELGV